jgi:hypothetical protein
MTKKPKSAASPKSDELEKLRPLIDEMIAALELCLECEGLTWEAEQAADTVVRRVKTMIS